ncbi:MAG TPA: PH domain-containing protein [Pyrinomonadaceae bacterium]|nr:PH domain-containing protein [Pyrinomonadaceae bacterium]
MNYCTKCGRQNADDAVYCQQCGSMLEPEHETRVARRGGDRLETGIDDPAVIAAISPTLKFVTAGYVLAVVGAFLVAALYSIAARALGSDAIWPGVILGMSLLLIPAYFHLRQKLVTYRLTDSTVEIDTGLISRTTQNIPLRRIQDVTVSSTILQRLLGFGDVVIDNASETGGKVVLHNINSPRKYADLMLRQMHRLEK